MQKRLCRRPESFNDESIHYGIRSLCFCCHKMYTFIISPLRTESIVPLRQTTLNEKFIKKTGKKTTTNTHKYKQRCASMHTDAHISLSKDNKHPHHDFFPPNLVLSITAFIKNEEKCNKISCNCMCCSKVSYSNQIYESVMKHFMLIVFVYEQINGSRAKRMTM